MARTYKKYRKEKQLPAFIAYHVPDVKMPKTECDNCGGEYYWQWEEA